jgi:predicted heme/steroid binding protein
MFKHISFIVLAGWAVCFAGHQCATVDTAAKKVDTLAKKTDSSAAPSVQAMDTLLLLTIEELARYNGKNGMQAYVAVDSVIYDVTGVPAWKNGSHHGVKAGTDASKAIKKSPHGKKVLKKLKAVGKLK